MSRKFYTSDKEALVKSLGKEKLVGALKKMLLIRNFEIRAESAYQQGKVGGFFHAYIGQEALQTAAVDAMGEKNWWATSYRCHALALLLGATPEEIMAELYGRANGNALGRGGSMHLYADRLLGGFGIVGGQIPISAGAGFSLKYKNISDEVSVCFFGDGAVPQGAFHETLNLASLWNLPCIFVIENNQWGMGTACERANCVGKLAEDKAPSFNMKGYTIDGMDYFNCYQALFDLKAEVLKNQRPILIEAITDRFRGHSISDPGLYRTKEALKERMMRDPILLLKTTLIENGMLSEEKFKSFDKEAREIGTKAMAYADESPWPDLASLESDVFAPEACV